MTLNHAVARAALTLAVLCLPAHATDIETRMLPVGGNLSVRVQVYRPEGPVRGDVLYLHGFADRADNHGPLFEEWNRQGLRVIAFDLPSHGETTGPGNDIDRFSFRDLARLATTVERDTRETIDRPLLLAGWSTGGLLAVRMLQSKDFPAFDRPVSGAMLFAPGVAVRPLVGTLGVVTQHTLTRNPNPPHEGPIKPISPLLKPVFAARLVLNSLISQHERLSDIPTLVFVGGESEDRYVETGKIKTWIEKQRRAGADITAIALEGGYHELDNEPGASGEAVRALAARFASNVVEGRPEALLPVANPCQALLTEL